ncbi:MAG: translation initiation factor IF-3 [Patescibacteria group bacterium]
MQNPKLNNQIKATELMVIGDDGQNLGKMATTAALKLAHDKGLDLIEIAPNAKPPVAKIMSFDKYRYTTEKKLKKQKALQKTSELKQVQISPKEALHDLRMKADRVNKFMEEGNQVEIVMVLRGREKGNRPFAREKLASFVKIINPEHKVIAEPKDGGRGINMQVTKK